MDSSFYPKDHKSEKSLKRIPAAQLEPGLWEAFLGGLSKQYIHHAGQSALPPTPWVAHLPILGNFYYNVSLQSKVNIAQLAQLRG